MAEYEKLTGHLSCRITTFQDQTIEDLKNQAILGDDRAEVVRALLQLAIVSLAENGQLKKLEDWRKSLRKN
jgi:hypothetical protein